MSVKVQVLDRYDKPVQGARVFVSWVSGGHSERRTDANGQADLGTSGGTAEYIQIDGTEVSGRMQLTESRVMQFTHPNR